MNSLHDPLQPAEQARLQPVDKETGSAIPLSPQLKEITHFQMFKTKFNGNHEVENTTLIFWLYNEYTAVSKITRQRHESMYCISKRYFGVKFEQYPPLRLRMQTSSMDDLPWAGVSCIESNNLQRAQILRIPRLHAIYGTNKRPCWELRQ